MIFIIAAILLALAAIRLMAPVTYLVHAGVADDYQPSGKPSHTRWIAAGRAANPDGTPLDLSGKFLGLVVGPSMEKRHIRDGSHFAADYIHEGWETKIKVGDIVVAKEFSEDGGPENYCYCLRQVRSVVDGRVEYEDSIHGTHRPHAFERVVARVSYVFDRSPAASLVALIN